MSPSEAREIFDRDYAPLILDGRSVKVARDTRPGTVSDLFAGYVAHLKSENKRSWSDAEQQLNKAADVIGRNVLAREVTPDDVLPCSVRFTHAASDRWLIMSAAQFGPRSPGRSSRNTIIEVRRRGGSISCQILR